MTISVTQLNNYIRGIFEIDGVLSDLSVCGEITNVKKSYNGWYFTLKDDDSAINCFCYSGASEPVQGVMAVAEGQLNYFAKSGSVSLFVRKLVASNNTGAAYQKFVELRDKLSKEGLFEETRKKYVPHSARLIGVVTSETGAVIHDIVNVSLRRQPFSDILLYPVKVQGADADRQIAEGIRYFDKSDVDVVIVGRGGGSNEDLSAFNSEIVVRAIAECSKPIVSAVGHGVDFTLSDFAADKRAVTPSEAAEFVTLDVEREKARIFSHLDKIYSSTAALLQNHRNRVENDCKLLGYSVGRKLDNMKSEIRYCLKGIELAANSKSEHIKSDLYNVVDRLHSVNPVNILKRGFGYVTEETLPVKSVRQLNLGDKIQIRFYDGCAEATVTNKKEAQ